MNSNLQYDAYNAACRRLPKYNEEYKISLYCGDCSRCTRHIGKDFCYNEWHKMISSYLDIEVTKETFSDKEIFASWKRLFNRRYNKKCREDETFEERMGEILEKMKKEAKFFSDNLFPILAEKEKNRILSENIYDGHTYSEVMEIEHKHCHECGCKMFYDGKCHKTNDYQDCSLYLLLQSAFISLDTFKKSEMTVADLRAEEASASEYMKTIYGCNGYCGD